LPVMFRKQLNIDFGNFIIECKGYFRIFI